MKWLLLILAGSLGPLGWWLLGSLIQRQPDPPRRASQTAPAAQKQGRPSIDAAKAQVASHPVKTVAAAAEDLRLRSPRNGAVLRGRTVVRVRTGTTEATSVRFSVDGVVRQESRSTPFDWIWNTNEEKEGRHILGAVPVRNGVVVGKPESVTVEIDNYRSVPWAVTLHANPDHNGNGTSYEEADYLQAREDLDKARSLGFRYVRIDFRWREIQPQEVGNDDRAVGFYRWFVTEAKARRLEIIGVLQTYEPEWASELRLHHWDRWLEAVGGFTTLCASQFGDGVSYWQMLNESNRIVRMGADLMPPTRAVEAFKAMSEAVRQNDRVAPAKTVVNLFTDIDGFSWRITLEIYLRTASDYIDVFAIDHYPGTWSPYPADRWTDLEELMSVVSEKPGKSVAIIETGFATYAPLIADEAAQKRFVETAIPSIRRVVSRPPAGAERVKMEFAGWYHLYDEVQKESDLKIVLQEGKFGFLRADRSEKPAAAEFKKLIAEP